jgi:hypothetical protein
MACPICGGLEEGGAVEIDDNQAHQECWCTRCGATWTDVYVHKDVYYLEAGDMPDEYQEHDGTRVLSDQDLSDEEIDDLQDKLDSQKEAESQAREESKEW